MTSDNKKPLPLPQPESDFYWQEAANGRLVVQRCGDCGNNQFYPRVFCTKCSSRNVEWTESSGKGTVFTFAIVHQPPHSGFVDDAPYVTAIVELEEGVRMPSQLIGIDPDPALIDIGMPVEVVFEKVTGEMALPKFRPVQ